MTSATQWTPAHQTLAHLEGWDLFAGHEEGTQLCRLDNPQDWEDCPLTEPLGGDEEAWAIVHRGFVAGSWLHCHAMAVLSVENPAEYDRVRSA